MDREHLIEPRKGQLGQEEPAPTLQGAWHRLHALCTVHCPLSVASSLLLCTAVTISCPPVPPS